MTARSLPVIPADVRPRTRGECEGVVRPCPWTSCSMHTGAGSIAAASFLGDDIACTLDLADRGGMTLEDVSAVFGLTRERIRQIEDNAMYSMRRDLRTAGVVDEEPGPGDVALAQHSHRSKTGEAVRSARLDGDGEWEPNAPANGVRDEPEGYRAPSFFEPRHDDSTDEAVAERVWVMFSRRHGIVSKSSAAVSKARAAKRAKGITDEYVRPTQSMVAQATFTAACAALEARGEKLTAAAVHAVVGDDVPGLSLASIGIKLRRRADGEKAKAAAKEVREAPIAALPVPPSNADFWIDEERGESCTALIYSAVTGELVIDVDPKSEEATAEPEPPPSQPPRKHKANREGASGRARRVQTDAAVLEIVAAMNAEGVPITDTAVGARWGRSRAMAGYVLTRLRSAGHDIGRVRVGPVRDDPVVRVALLAVVKEGLNPTYPLLLERLGWNHGSYRRLAASLERLRRDDRELPQAKTWRPPGRLMQLVLVAAQGAIEDGKSPTAAEVYRRIGVDAGRSEGNVGNALRKLRRDGKLPETPHTTALIRTRSAMHKKHEDKIATLDEARHDVVEVDTRATRVVPPHRDHGVEGAKTTSTAKMAAALGRPSGEVHPVRGVLAQAELEDGSFIVRLTGASASMHALVQLASSVGADVEIVIVRRI